MFKFLSLPLDFRRTIEIEFLLTTYTEVEEAGAREKLGKLISSQDIFENVRAGHMISEI